MPAPPLNLPASPQRLVFRKIESVMRNDPTLKRVVKRWQTWTGCDVPNDLRAPALTDCPVIRLTPFEGSDTLRGPASFVTALVVQIDLFLGSSNADDAMDLYWAVRRSLYPESAADRNTIHSALVTAGARAAFTLVFSQPNFQPVPDGETVMLRARGQLKLDLLETLNP